MVCLSVTHAFDDPHVTPISLLGLVFHKGHPVDGSWVFGIFERNSTKCILFVVEKRDASTLVPLIEKHILPGDMLEEPSL